MKRSLYFILLAGGSIFYSSCSNTHSFSLVVSNPSDFERADEPVVITREEMAAFAEIPDKKVPKLKTDAGYDIPSQADDLNKDGVWDELAFVYSFKPKENATLQVEYVSPEDLPKYTPKAGVRFGVSP